MHRQKAMQYPQDMQNPSSDSYKILCGRVICSSTFKPNFNIRYGNKGLNCQM